MQVDHDQAAAQTAIEIDRCQFNTDGIVPLHIRSLFGQLALIMLQDPTNIRTCAIVSLLIIWSS